VRVTQRKAFFAAGLAALIASSALAQAPAEGTPTRIRGTVEKLDGKTLTLKTRDGQTATVSLADNFAVSALAKKTLGDVKANDYIASTGIRGTDGKLHCVELRVFPEALRGTAEGQFPWDSIPEATMTNATVTGITTASDGHTFRVKYKDKESEFVAGPDCQVFAYVPGDPALLKLGAAVFMVAQKKPDGGLSAGRVTAEKDGVKPPM
jgi:hypothetical protein